jgi:hypothetical protein
MKHIIEISSEDNIDENLFISSESPNNTTINRQSYNKYKVASNNDTMSATNAINGIDTINSKYNNEEKQNISSDDTDSFELNSKKDEIILGENFSPDKTNHATSKLLFEKENHLNESKKNKSNSISNIVNNMLSVNDNINGWDENANTTIKNWYKIFKRQSFIYQWILDRNRLISDRLSLASIISSSLLGIFSGFKLWINNNLLFQTTSDIILMLLNFGVALLTSASKRYIDTQRNETIRVYIEKVDSFLGEISAQVLKSPIYRINATDFFNLNNDKYTELISTSPNLSIYELNTSKIVYNTYVNLDITNDYIL